MMGMRMPETCWAVFKRQVINLRNCCIWLVDSVECMMMHGLANLKFKKLWVTFILRAGRLHAAVDIMTLRPERSGIRNPVWERFSLPVQPDPEVHPASCIVGIWSLSLGYSGWCAVLTTHSLLVPKSYSVPWRHVIWGNIPII
jgi:hypothetical protein